MGCLTIEWDAVYNEGLAPSGCPGCAGLQDPELGPVNDLKPHQGNSANRSGFKEETKDQAALPKTGRAKAVLEGPAGWRTWGRGAG